MWYVRERYNVSGGDNTRGKHQMKVISAVVAKLSAATILTVTVCAVIVKYIKSL